MTEIPVGKTLVRIVSGKYKGRDGLIVGTLDRGAHILSALVTFSDGRVTTKYLTDLREATPLEKIMYEG